MIIVSDSGPLAYLIEIDVADFLPSLYGQVYIPPAELAELAHPLSPAHSWTRNLPNWITVAAPQSIPSTVQLDRGESEAIALALELGADRILIDEGRGRQVARSHGLKIAGTFAVIVDGAKKGFFDGHAALDKLERTNFYASTDLVRAVRELLPPA